MRVRISKDLLIVLGIAGGLAAGLAFAINGRASTAKAPQAPFALRSALMAADGLVVTDGPNAEPTVPARQAIDVAKHEFVWAHGSNARAYVGSFTDPHRGTLLAGLGGPILLLYSNKPVWVVVIHDATIPLHLPVMAPRVTAHSRVTDLAVFVDAFSGKYLEAITVQL